MGIFSRRQKNGEVSDKSRIDRAKVRYEASKVPLENVPVDEILNTPNFVHTYYKASSRLDEPSTKDTEFKVVRFVYRNEPPNVFDYTHKVIVSKVRGKKEYEASIQIVDGKIVKSIVYDFYG